VQLAAGTPSALPVLAGAVAGGLLHKLAGERIRRPVDGAEKKKKKKDEALTVAEKKKKKKKKDEALTVAEKLDVDQRLALAAYEVLAAAGVLALVAAQPTPSGRLNAVAGGLLIGGAQLASVALTGAVLGTSSSFEEAASWLLWGWERLRGRPGSATGRRRPSSTTLRFVAGLTAGGYLAMRLWPALRISGGMPASDATLFLGGVVMIFGSRMAGGCTSGHGISGMSFLALSSLWTVASIFTAGTALGCVLHR
jgi:Sulphur transport